MSAVFSTALTAARSILRAALHDHSAAAAASVTDPAAGLRSAQNGHGFGPMGPVCLHGKHTA